MSIRILLVTHYFASHKGGVESVAGQIAKRLEETKEFDITWFASSHDLATENLSINLVPIKAWNGLEKWGIPYPLWSPKAIGQLAHAVRASDLVHLHDFIYIGNLLAFAFARWFKRPVVITQHIADIPYRNIVLRAIHKMMNRTLGRFVLSRATRVIFISASIREYFSKFVRVLHPPEFFPNGVDTNVFRPISWADRVLLRKKLGIEPDHRVLLFVGRFVEKKGLPLLRTLATANSEWHWWFAGWGSPSQDPEYWGLPNIRVFREVSGESLAELYQAADLLVLPSVGEGFPLVVQEAMACGTPALVTDSTAEGSPAAKPYLLTQKLDTEKPSVGWSDSINKYLSSKDFGEETHRQKIASFAKQEWSWKTCVEQYGRLFKELTITTNG